MKKAIFAVFYVGVLSQCSANQQLFPPYTCTTTICQPAGSKESSEIRHLHTQQGRPGKRGGSGPKGEKGDPCECDVTDGQTVRDLRNKLNSQTQKFNEVMERLERLENFTKNISAIQQEIGSRKSQEDSDTSNFSPDADGWTVIQRRQDGSVDFQQNWESYAKGFGNRQGEFWLGLRNIHELTTAKSCKLRIDMKTWTGTKQYAEYSKFQVANEESLFRLAISGFSGNVSDRMSYHNGQAFSTLDRDNDKHGGIHCAKRYKGAWWHKSCYYSNPNGVYFKTENTDVSGIRWETKNLPFVEIKVQCS